MLGLGHLQSRRGWGGVALLDLSIFPLGLSLSFRDLELVDSAAMVTGILVVRARRRCAMKMMDSFGAELGQTCRR